MRSGMQGALPHALGRHATGGASSMQPPAATRMPPAWHEAHLLLPRRGTRAPPPRAGRTPAGAGAAWWRSPSARCDRGWRVGWAGASVARSLTARVGTDRSGASAPGSAARAAAACCLLTFVPLTRAVTIRSLVCLWVEQGRPGRAAAGGRGLRKRSPRCSTTEAAIPPAQRLLGSACDALGPLAAGGLFTWTVGQLTTIWRSARRVW